jgi:hypothetical protein
MPLQSGVDGLPLLEVPLRRRLPPPEEALAPTHKKEGMGWDYCIICRIYMGGMGGSLYRCRLMRMLLIGAHDIDW